MPTQIVAAYIRYANDPVERWVVGWTRKKTLRINIFVTDSKEVLWVTL